MDWEWLKYKIKTTSIKFAKDDRSRQMAHEKDLRWRYQILSEEADKNLVPDLDELRSIKRELKEI